MDQRRRKRRCRNAQRRRTSVAGSGLLAAAVVAALVFACAGAQASAAVGASPAAAATERPTGLVLEGVELEGASHTPLETVLLYLPLRPGQVVDQQTLLAAVDELRAGGLFRKVDFYTRPGSARGRLVLVLDVVEHGFDVRLGTGNTDLDGWYLVPVMLALDDQLGRGERIDLAARIGFRHAGILLSYAEPRIADGRSGWGMRLYGLTTDRPYFFEDVELKHRVDRGGADFAFVRQLGGVWSLETGLVLETVEVDSTSRVAADVPEREVEQGDELAYGDLPAAVRAAVGERKRQALHLDLLIDSRGRERIAGAPNRGFWGRLKAEVVHDDVEIFTRATFDLRGYRSLAGGAVAARARVSWVDSPAPFYDRLYLGGLYTVRGFPTHSLSSPGGDTWLWTGTLEYRAPLIGSGERTRLAGGLFADVGASGSAADAVFRTPSASLGWGLRLRLGFVGWIGLDVGYPVTRGPYDEAFHVNATIGWSF